jgi:hypothetical protein
MIALKRPSPAVFWAIFGLATLLLSALAHSQPELVERWYSRGLFQAVRRALDWTLGLLPFPPFYLFWIGVAVFWTGVARRRPRAGGFWTKFRFWLSRAGGFLGLLIGLFFWMWGFNYARVPLPEQLGLTVAPLDSASLWQELQAETLAVDALRARLAGTDTAALDDRRFWPPGAEDTIRQAVEKWLSAEKFPVGGQVRGRYLYPEGLLFLFGASGVYWPFTGEGNLEAGLHPLRKLPNMAHEMSHGYGFANEGVCNFIAFAALWDHPDPYIAYCARLDYWNALARACRRTDPERFKNLVRNGLSPGILADERAIRRQHDRFRELAPTLRYLFYDNYLKSQGIQAGMASYDEVLMLVRAWRSRDAN